ncbi:MAG: GIY-YIG nuclease family protein [Candidatus Verstraetearchaeota archaeon]|nr:GIY-YIG nuclease family protein [Candidatus Verstraetearchaeota archaeon]
MSASSIPTAKRGGYALVIGFSGGLLKFGNREEHFEAGTYVYSGSALGGIKRRVERHVRMFYRIGRKRHWHIDALLERCEQFATICAQSNIRTECRLVFILVSAYGMKPVSGFGSTDCRSGCKGHLLRSNVDFEGTVLAVMNAFRQMGLEPSECGRWDRILKHPMHHPRSA